MLFNSTRKRLPCLVSELYKATLEICIDAYNKKQEFGGGFISIKKFNNINCKLDMELEKSSKIMVN